jgi:hypothetical protein
MVLPQQLPMTKISKSIAAGGKELTDCLLRGPMRVYRSPYSAVVTGAFDLMTE